MRKLLFLIVLMILPLAAIADNVGMTKTLTYHFTGISNDGLVSNNPKGGGENAFWLVVSGSYYWSNGASAIGAHCSVYSRVYTWSRETFPEVVQKVTINAGAWSDGPTSLKLNNREVSLKTMTTSAYAGNESRIKFDDYVFENVITSDNKGHLLLDYITSGEADIFIRSITVEYIEVECDMSEIPADNAFYAATSFLCERGVLDGSKVDGKYIVEEKLLRKHLANITFRGLFTLNGREIPSKFVSDQYPGIYEDLKSDASYYQAAKTLLYLDYGDGITPFDRDRDGFFPDGYESRINILKELMEAFNIKPDTEGKNNPFPNDPGIAQLSETSPIRMGYVRRAAKLGIITTENTEFHPFVDCLRGEAFLMLARIIQKIEAGEITDPNPQESDFLDPNSGTGTAEPYAVLSADKTVLTFYYDGQKAKRGGMDVGPFNTYPLEPSWYKHRESITSVVFDPSFANCTTITRTACWFYEFAKLTSITGLKYLKTDKVTNMYRMFASCSSLKSLDLSNFNTANVTDMDAMFYNCRSLTSLDLSKFNTANVTDMYDMFNCCYSLTSLDVTGFKTDKVRNMSCMFANLSSLTSLDLSNLNTTNVTNMESMFNGSSSLKNLDLSNFNTANVTDMEGMFSSCSGLTSLDLSNFNTANVTDMRGMFSGCSGLTNLDLSCFKTDKVTDMVSMFGWCSNLKSLNISGFNTNNVTSMLGMFTNCSSLTSLDLSGFSNEKVTSMDNMFADCSRLTSINLSDFKTNNVTGMFYMFGGCSGLTSLDLSSFNTDNATNMMWMFDHCSNLKTIYASDEWSIAKVKSSPNVFRDCTNLVGGAGTTFDANHTDYTYAHIDGGTANPGYFTAKTGGDLNGGGNAEPYAALSDESTVLTFYYDNQKEQRNGMGIEPFTKGSDRGWSQRCGLIKTVVFDPSFAECTSLTSTAFWFYYCTNLTSLTGLQYLKTDHVTDMKNMFDNCQKLESLNVSGLNTSNVTDMSWLFSRCFALKNLDVSGLNTSKVTNMSNMFAECWNLTSLDVSGFNTSNVTDMSWLFSGLSGQTSIDVTGFNTSNVTDMSCMFRYCRNMPEIDISSFKTDNVTTMDQMFDECYGLKTIYAGDGWSTVSVTSSKDMFRQCTILKGGAGTTYYGCDAKDYTAAHIDGGTANPGYFTDVSAKPVIGGPKPYAVLSDNNTVVTFYYDDQKDVRGGMDIINSHVYNSPYGTATTAVFDASFADYRPTSTAYWFTECSSLTGITGMENLKTENVTNMYCMFFNCKSLTSLDLSSLDTQNVTDMGWMFECCSGLTSLDLSSFDTRNVSDMSDMFSYCSSLTTIYAGSEWSTAAVTDGSAMFYNCFKLKGGAGTTYNGFFGHAYARIDGGADNPGYFTAKADADLNDDGKVDEADLTVLVNVVMGGDKNKLSDADLNHDGKVDAADIVMLVNIIKSQKKEGRQ